MRKVYKFCNVMILQYLFIALAWTKNRAVCYRRSRKIPSKTTIALEYLIIVPERLFDSEEKYSLEVVYLV